MIDEIKNQTEQDLITNNIEQSDVNFVKQPRGNEVFGMFQTISAVPTKEPVNWFNQIQYYKNGATLRIYIYDNVNHVWSYASLT